MGYFRSPEADTDLDNIWHYTATKSSHFDVADRLIDSITRRFFLLASHPNIGRSRGEDLHTGMRSFPVGEYVIIYHVLDEDVLILRVLHGNCDIQAMFGD